MAMNREQKRALQKQGQLGADGAPVATRDRRQPAKAVKEERTRPAEFVREVRAELKKTSWPTRKETLRLALIVFVAIVVLGAFIFAVDLAFASGQSWLYKSPKSASPSAAVVAAYFL